MIAHAMTRKVLKWTFCSKCGLISLRNKSTQRALAAACPGPRERADVSFAINELDRADKVWAGLKAKGWR